MVPSSLSSLSSSSSSFFKKSSKREISLESLPEDLLVEVSSCTAAFSLSALCNLRIVSKTFRQTCDEKYVLSRLSLHELPLIPWSRSPPENFNNFFKRCRRNGNPEALYRRGLIHYFQLENQKHNRLEVSSVENRKHKGLKLLSEAAKKGNKEAIYVYGLIIICRAGKGIPEGPVLIGGETKQEGFTILSSLIKPLMSKTLKELEELRGKIINHILWRGLPVMKELKRAYVREKCECDGQTKNFLAYNCARWDRYGGDNDMNTSSACEFCLWDHEFRRFFENAK